jgi:antitoxin MazE
MRVLKWGNSLAVRLPAAVVEALDLKQGDQIEISISGCGVLYLLVSSSTGGGAPRAAAASHAARAEAGWEPNVTYLRFVDGSA